MRKNEPGDGDWLSAARVQLRLGIWTWFFEVIEAMDKTHFSAFLTIDASQHAHLLMLFDKSWASAIPADMR